MGRRAISLGFVATSIVVWTAFVAYATLQGFWRPALSEGRDVQSFMVAAETAVPEDFRGNLVAVAVEGGTSVAELVMGPQDAIPDRDSVFQIASLSKWVTAVGVLVLVDGGLVALDDPVEMYLTRWQFPDGPFDSREVTIRRLLSHTAGLADGLGYNGFLERDDVQSIENSLDGAADAMEDASVKILIGIRPGTRFAYSGGGYTVLQLMVEEVTGLSFAEAMDELVFRPLEMDSSSFDYDDVAAKLAPIFDADGRPTPHRHYSATAAASLYTTAGDMVAFLSALNLPKGEGGLLSQDVLAATHNSEALVFGSPFWGLGVTLYVTNNNRAVIIGHDGRNIPATTTAGRIHPPSGDGLVILATGHESLATELADKWVYWRTGYVAITALPHEGRIGLALWLVGLFALYASHRILGWNRASSNAT